MAIDTEALIAVVREAGRLALDRSLYVARTRKADKTWVTDADLAVEEYLVGALPTLAAGSVVLGEEGGLRRGGASRLVWAVDPIDGTADYVRGLPGWSVSAALFDGGEPVAGVMIMPVTGDLYVFERERATWCGKRVETLSDSEIDDDSLILVPAGAHHVYKLDHPGKIQCVGSSSAHILYVARGAAAGAVVDPLYIWDLGVSVPFLRTTGGEACYLSGAPLVLGDLLDGRRSPEPVVFAPKQLLDAVRRGISVVALG
jgi:myo-inositol-1(or 4)-monophosphatase